MKKVEPEVNLLSYMDDAINILVYTKSNRLDQNTSYDDVKKMGIDKKREHLEYMFYTTQNSFENINYVFEIKNASRAFMQQLERTRTAGYQEKSLRVVDARDFNCTITTEHPLFEKAVKYSKECYATMVEDGEEIQNARGVLPINIHSSVIVVANLRTLSQIAEKRLCTRTQGEYQDIFKILKKKIIDVHPWAEKLLKVYCAKYAICCFPRYKNCPIQQYCFDPSERINRIQDEWENCDHKADPASKFK